MPILIIETEINALPEVCFDLVRDISLHVQTTKQTGEKQNKSAFTAHNYSLRIYFAKSFIVFAGKPSTSAFNTISPVFPVFCTIARHLPKKR